jgi:Uma2 family endonuclease
MMTSVDPPRTTVRTYRFTYDEVLAMADAGMLPEHEHVELIDGQLVPMSPVGDSHISCVDELTHLLVERLPAGSADTMRVSVRSPLRIDAHNAPEPDVVVKKSRGGAAKPETTLLVVEVSDTTLTYDRETKLPLYAEAGLPEVWIVNLQARQVEVYREPKGTAYGLRRLVDAEETLTIEALPDGEPIVVSDILLE